jgi:type IV secretion system protein VirB4
LNLRKVAVMNRELFASVNIPYAAHVHENVVRTKQGHYVQGFKLTGASFESADDEQINNWHERLNVLWRNIASDKVALWTHVVRRRENVYPDGQFPAGFSQELNDRYRKRLAGETLMVNELYVSVVYRPQPSTAGKAALNLMEWLSRLFSKWFGKKSISIVHGHFFGK